MAFSYLVGIHHGNKHGSVTIEAEDALIAGLKAKQQNPEVTITYIRRQNKRGDIRHPHGLTRKAKAMKPK